MADSGASDHGRAQAAGSADVPTEGPGFPRRIDLKLIRGNIIGVSAPAYVLGIFDNVNPTGAARSVDRLLGGALSALVQDRMIGSRLGEISLLPTPRRALRADLIGFAGLGPISLFKPKVMETVAENLARVFITTQIHSLASVVIGSNAGASIAECFSAFMNGFLRGLDQRDTEHDFRTIYICEMDKERYAELLAVAYTYSPPADLGEIDLVRREIDLGDFAAPEAPGKIGDSLELTYLTVQQQPVSGPTRRYSFGVLTGGQGAAITKDEHSVEFMGKKALDRKLDKARQGENDFGSAVSEFYLPEATRAAVHGSLKKSGSSYLVVAHDRDSADIPWEAMPLADGYYPAIEAGISRKLTTDARIATRSHLPSNAKLKMLLIRNPTKNLAGAEVECDDIVKMFRDREIEPTVLRHSEATVSSIVEELGTKRYDILHYAGHAIFDPRYHGNSGLICHGNERLTAKMLQKLEIMPQLVVLNGCQSLKVRGDGELDLPDADETCEVPLAREDDRFFWEKLSNNLDDQASLAEAMMLRGVMNIIGTYWPVGDAAAQLFSRNFYASLLSGDRLGLAMCKARRAVRDIGSSDWANYLHYGDPEYLLRRK